MMTLEKMKNRLDKLESGFEQNGGRGVEVADEIDQLRQDITIEKWRAKSVSSKSLRRALGNVLNYLWGDEEKDWRSNGSDFGPLGQHILGSVLTIDAWMRRKKKR